MLDIISRLRVFSGKKLLRAIILITLIAVPCILIDQYFPWIFNHIILEINLHAIPLRLIRWAIILILVIFWPQIVGWISQQHNFSKEKTAYWQRERYHVALWLILFELLICENIIIKLIRLI